jgi:hypothetical protein
MDAYCTCQNAHYSRRFMIMPNDIDHLPTAKQRELERIVEVIFDEFRGATENAIGPGKGAPTLKIILFDMRRYVGYC